MPRLKMNYRDMDRSKKGNTKPHPLWWNHNYPFCALPHEGQNFGV